MPVPVKTFEFSLSSKKLAETFYCPEENHKFLALKFLLAFEYLSYADSHFY